MVAAGLLAAGGWTALAGTKPSTAVKRVAPIVVTARPIAAFDKLAPERTRFGKLTWRGGLVLSSQSEHFGGWSGLVLARDGKGFIAVSDAGAMMTGEIAYAQGRPQAVRSARLGPIKARSGRTLSRSRNIDAEGIELIAGTPAAGRVLISFERNHRIGRFDVDTDKGLAAPERYLALPAAARRLSANRGLEAIALIRGGAYKGSLVAIAERLQDGSGNHTGWLWVKGKPRTFYLANGDGFDITDAAGLPDGSLLVLERRFRWSEGVKARLRLVGRDELRPGALVRGKILLDADMNQEIDNMEGLAVHAGPGGETIVTMISDDNFNRGLQRTVLLQFALDAGELASTRPRP